MNQPIQSAPPPRVFYRGTTIRPGTLRGWLLRRTGWEVKAEREPVSGGGWIIGANLMCSTHATHRAHLPPASGRPYPVIQVQQEQAYGLVCYFGSTHLLVRAGRRIWHSHDVRVQIVEGYDDPAQKRKHTYHAPDDVAPAAGKRKGG